MRLLLSRSILLVSSLSFADGAIICKSDSKGACAGRQYCCYSGGESDGDKACQKLGCVRGGTSSCPTAANVSSCGTRDVKIKMSAQDEPNMSIAPEPVPMSCTAAGHDCSKPAECCSGMCDKKKGKCS